MAAVARQSLQTYHAKRNFKSTPEPKGNLRRNARRSSGKRARMLCVQKHLASHLHYDFRLEHNGVLLSWAVPKGPSLNPKDKRLAMRVEDHPLEYGDFEGVIPEGYGAGIVMLWDQGIWEPEVADVDAALEKGDLKFTLKGTKLKGLWVLVRTRGFHSRRSKSDEKSQSQESRSWLLIKHRDEWAGDIDVTKRFDKSIKSFGDFAEIVAQENPEVWESHKPAEGGSAGKMLRQVIERAAKIKAGRTKGKSGGATRRGGKKR